MNFRSFFGDALLDFGQKRAVSPGDFYLDSAMLDCKVLAGRMRVFAGRVFASTIAAPLGILQFAWVGIETVGWQITVAWACVMLALEIQLGLISRRYQQVQPPNADINKQVRHLSLMCFVVGLGWGVSVWLFFKEGELASYLLNMALVIGVAGVSVMSMSPFRLTAIPYFSALLLVPAFHGVVYSTQFSLNISVGMALLLLLLLGYTRLASGELISDLESTIRSGMLAERLQLALSATSQEWFDLDLKTQKILTSGGNSHSLIPENNGEVGSFAVKAWIDTIHPVDQPHVRSAIAASQGDARNLNCFYRLKKNGLWMRMAGKVVDFDFVFKPKRVVGLYGKCSDAEIVNLNQLRGVVSTDITPSSNTGRRVLLVDDNVDSNMVFAMVLESAGMTVQCALTSQEAIKLVGEIGVRYDFVLMDHDLGSASLQDGIQLASELTRMGQKYLFGYTGNYAAELFARWREAGVTHIFRKPVEIRELLAKLDSVMGGAVDAAS